MNTPKLLYLISLIVISFPAYSQSYFFKKYSVKDGLPQSQVNVLHQDSRGLLWMGTAGGGVAVYDGSEFQVINEQLGLGGNIVVSIAEDSEGKIYIGSTWGGISVIENMNVRPLTDDEGFSKIVAQELMIDKENRLWISNTSGVYYHDVNGFFKIDFGDSKPHNIRQMHSSGNKIWAIAENTLYRVFPNSQTVKAIYSADTTVTSMLIDEDEKICLGIANKGMVYLDSVEWEKGINKINNDFPDITVLRIKKDVKGELCLLTENNGIFRTLNKENYVNYDLSNGLQTLNLHSFEVDNYNTLWVGTGGEGLLQYDDNPFISFDETSGFRSPDNFALLKASDGSLWTGNMNKGVFYIKDGKLNHLTESNGLPSNVCFTIEEGKNGDIWIGTSKGLVRWNKGIKGVIDEKDGLPNAFIKSIGFIGDKMFVGTNGGGLVEIENGNIRVYNEKDGLNSLHIHSIFPDGDVLWFGTGSGLYRLKDGSIESYSENEGLCNTYVGNIVKDKNGVIWVGTDRCISSLKDGKFQNYNTSQGLFSDVVYVMITDNEGNIWVGSNLGLDKIAVDENSEILSIRHYGYAEGFRGVECNSGGVCKDKSGNLYFTTIGGVYQYKPSLDYQINNITQVYITQAKTIVKDAKNYYSGRINWFGVGDSMTVSYGNNYVSIRFKGINLKNAGNLSYSYKLDGFDKMWLKTDNNEAIYSNIPPGKYVFRVSACPYGNCANSNESVLYLSVDDPPVPFYKSGLALFLYAVLVLSILYYFAIFRGKHLRRQNEILESRVRERTKKIFKQNEEKTIMLQEIHHRVKNNLQIINSLFNIQKRYTNSNEAIELFNASQTRILAMAKIHEKLYEAKDLSRVNVREYVLDLIREIKDNYELDKNITLNIEIEEIEMNMDVLIPFALIINEIISNSFKYAFNNQESGKIDIRISQTVSGVTHVYISDNGSGFDRTGWEEPQSMGMELIQTLAEQIDAKVDLKTSDGTTYDIEFLI